MTRSADAALDEAQLKLGNACEELLASKAWQRSHPETYSGLKLRLQLLEEAGLPRMRVVPNTKLEELGRIPRSNEGHQVDALEAVKKLGKVPVEGNPRAVILFYSHRWARPNWCEALGKDLPWGSEERNAAMARGEVFGDPDDADHTKATALIEYAKWFERARRKFSGLNNETKPKGISHAKKIEIFWWIDWACTNQDDPGPDMAALPAYAATCAGIVAAWNDVYKDRAWCQVELLMAYAFMTTGNKVWVVPPAFKNGATWPIRVEVERVVVADPAKGLLTNTGDRPVIESLTNVASGSTAFTCLNNFINNSTRNVGNGIFLNVCCCCQCFGLLAAMDARDVRPGDAGQWWENIKATKITPKGVASATHAASPTSPAPRFRRAPTAQVIARSEKYRE